MQTAFYFIGCIVLLFGSIYIGFKVLELMRQWKSKEFKTNLAEFLADLYKLKIKWSDRGEFGYVGSIDNMIKFHGNVEITPKPGGVGLPLTNDAASTNIQLKNSRKEELRETMEEWINEF